MATAANSITEARPADQASVSKGKEKKPKASMNVFLMLLVSAAMLVLPAAAAPSINLTWVGPMIGSLFDAITSIAPNVQSFVEAWFPVIVELVVYGAIIAVIGLGVYAFRGFIEAGIRMIETIFKKI